MPGPIIHKTESGIVLRIKLDGDGVVIEADGHQQQLIVDTLGPNEKPSWRLFVQETDGGTTKHIVELHQSGVISHWANP